MKEKPDLVTLLTAIGLLHIYRSLNKDQLRLLLTVDGFKNNLMIVPYNQGYSEPMSPAQRHMTMINEAHTLAYKELLIDAI
jgi:hypothetical protein